MQCKLVTCNNTQVCPLREAGSVFTLRLATSHHSFSLRRSVATRSTEDFYQLRVTTEILVYCV